jgi:hypothetical protein
LLTSVSAGRLDSPSFSQVSREEAKERFVLYRPLRNELGREKAVTYLLYVRFQLDRFEDNEMAVLVLYLEGQRSFDVLRELLPEGTRAGDVFKVSFAHDREVTERLAAENKSLLNDLLGRDD